jgi:hypothetical protein
MKIKLKYILVVALLGVAAPCTHYAYNYFKDVSAASPLSIQAQMDLPIGEGQEAAQVEWEAEPLPMAKAKPARKVEAKDDGKYKKVGWKDLASLNPTNGKISNPKFAAALKKPVKVPGFIVPMMDGGDNLGEFLLVPEPMMCIHVPAPPAEYIVTVRMKNPMPYPDDFTPWAPYWIKGFLRVEKVKSDLAESAYSMTAEEIELYDEPLE